jgi:hypothetical protein
MPNIHLISKSDTFKYLQRQRKEKFPDHTNPPQHLLDLEQQIDIEIKKLKSEGNWNNSSDSKINILIKEYESQISLYANERKRIDPHIYMPPEDGSVMSSKSNLSILESAAAVLSSAASTIKNMFSRERLWGVKLTEQNGKKLFTGKQDDLNNFFRSTADVHFEKFIVQKTEKTFGIWNREVDHYHASFGDGVLYSGSKKEILAQLNANRKRAFLSNEHDTANRFHDYAIEFESKVSKTNAADLRDKYKDWKKTEASKKEPDDYLDYGHPHY